MVGFEGSANNHGGMPAELVRALAGLPLSAGRGAKQMNDRSACLAPSTYNARRGLIFLEGVPGLEIPG